MFLFKSCSAIFQMFILSKSISLFSVIFFEKHS